MRRKPQTARLSWELDPVGAEWRGWRGIDCELSTASPVASHALLLTQPYLTSVCTQ